MNIDREKSVKIKNTRNFMSDRISVGTLYYINI